LAALSPVTVTVTKGSAHLGDGKFVRIGELPFPQAGRIEKHTPKSLGANILSQGHDGSRTGRRVDPDHVMTPPLEESSGALRSGSLDVGGVRLSFALGARMSSAETTTMFRLASIIFGSSRYEQNKVAAISWERTDGSRSQSAMVTFRCTA
jgi:hypothetical protein